MFHSVLNTSSIQNLFLKTTQYSQENTCVRVRPSTSTLVFFLWILRNFSERLLWRIPASGCFWTSNEKPGDTRSTNKVKKDNSRKQNCITPCKIVSVKTLKNQFIEIIYLRKMTKLLTLLKEITKHTLD